MSIYQASKSLRSRPLTGQSRETGSMVYMVWQDGRAALQRCTSGRVKSGSWIMDACGTVGPLSVHSWGALWAR